MNSTHSGDGDDRARAFRAARTAWRLAPDLCRPECRAYHRVRPLLRWLGLSAEPADQEAFFRQVLGQAFATGSATALVCGTSDIAMPDLVTSSAGGPRPATTVIDLCETPLRLVETEAVASDTIRTLVADALDWRPEIRFDLIATHSFLGQIAPEARSRLMHAWHDLLAPGGRLVTVNRLRPEGGGSTFGGSTVSGLAAEAAQRYDLQGGFDDVPARDIHAAVELYAQSRTTQPVRSIEDLRTLLEDAGLTVVSLDAVRSAPRAGRLAGPAMPDGAVYAHVVAQRPVE